MKVLLLEDQALVRAGMCALIEISEPEAKVTEVASFDEAVQALSAHPFDIAFLDVDLKREKSGIDVLKHLRAQRLTTRAVMLSAQSDETTVMECLRLGASGYILKDMEGDGLFSRALETVFSGKVFLPESAMMTPSAQKSSPPLISLEEIGVRGRALEVLYYICQGLPNQLIAYKMDLAESTIANDYNTRLFRQFRVTNRAALIVEVARRGLVVPKPVSADA